jgi:hypothetical protein
MRNLFRHPLSLVGAGFVLLSGVSILFLFAVEAISGRSNPYIGIFTYMVYPVLLVIGLILIPIGALLERRWRARHEGLPNYPILDLNRPQTRAAFMFVIVSSIFFMGLIASVTYEAYHYTESVGFCGEVCHSVMNPEYTAYQQSPHARVTCAECHVGSGAGWYVRSKLSGVYQIYSVLFHKYPQPIATPVHNLRPAQDTCEQCHWPEKFFGAQLKVITRFGHDEKNSVRQIRSLLRTGGGSPTSGITSGIHWHMNIGNEVWYGAADPQRQKIPWVRIRDRQGRVTEYVDRTASMTPEQMKKLEVRRMDCMDCHNRPSHIFRDPDSAVDTALLTGLIDRTLPYIKREAVRVLTQTYTSQEAAREGIATSLNTFYKKGYSQVYGERREAIQKAVAEVQKIYGGNIFPEMKVDWRTHPDNIGHTLFPGCFRCHDGNHSDREGRVLGKDCQLCHTIIGQETSIAKPTEVAAAEKFEHPWPLMGKHAQLNCNQCHWRGRGLNPECTTCHTRAADAPMASLPCSTCHLKDQQIQPTADCKSCHPSRAGLHLKATHAATDCTMCHVPHEWKVTKRDTCYTCHPDKTNHNPEGLCRDCHAFRESKNSA